MTPYKPILSILLQLSSKPINPFLSNIFLFWLLWLNSVYESYKIGQTNIMFIFFFTPAVLRESSFRLPVFHMESFTWLCLCNVNVETYIQSSFIPSTHESDWLMLHILQFFGALQGFMKKGYSSEYWCNNTDIPLLPMHTKIFQYWDVSYILCLLLSQLLNATSDYAYFLVSSIAPVSLP